MKIKSLTLALLASAAFVSCSDDFLQDKKSYDNVNEDAYNYYEGALGRLADIYSWCLPNASADPGHRNNSTGNADAQSKLILKRQSVPTETIPFPTISRVRQTAFRQMHGDAYETSMM